MVWLSLINQESGSRGVTDQLIKVKKKWSKSKKWSALEKEISTDIWTRHFHRLSNYGHTRLNPPHPVRSAQLNSRWQSQYYGGGPHGNTLCCNFFSFSDFLFFWRETTPTTQGREDVPARAGLFSLISLFLLFVFASATSANRCILTSQSMTVPSCVHKSFGRQCSRAQDLYSTESNQGHYNRTTSQWRAFIPLSTPVELEPHRRDALKI